MIFVIKTPSGDLKKLPEGKLVMGTCVKCISLYCIIHVLSERIKIVFLVPTLDLAVQQLKVVRKYMPTDWIDKVSES